MTGSKGKSLIGAGYNFIGSTANTNAFYGYITEVSRWSGSITDSLVSDLYNSGSPLDLRNYETNYYLTNYWKLSDVKWTNPTRLLLNFHGQNGK
jgi:hypothetical protein